MPYIVIEDFRAGLDRRKLAAASPPGSLQVLSNAHINRGGEIEKRRAMVATYALPAGQTYGLAGANGILYTFGSDLAPVVPAGVVYQRLQHPGGHAMNGIVSTEFYDGKVAVAARFTNGDVLLFYNGARVTAWDGGGTAPFAGQKPTALLTLKDKLYSAFLSILGFSAIAAPTDYSGTGAGFINMSNQSAGSEALTGLGRYQGFMAVFARRNTQIWSLDSDPINNAQRQVLSNIGTFAGRSIVSFGDVDVFFLSDTGIRSLRARDSSNQAGVSDVGTPIDDEVLTYLKTLTEEQKAAAVAIIDPIDGRYICAIGSRAYVFSYYASARISAWSSYDLGFTVSDFVSMDGRIWARGGDTVYLLGGPNGDSYDASTVTIETPYIDGRSIASFKSFTGFDLVSEGEWDVFINTNPRAPDEWSQIATVSDTSVAELVIGMVGYSPMIKLKLTTSDAALAKVSKLIVHFEAADQG
jgi:hypothetical protein